MENLVGKMHSLLFTALTLKSPVLSGNMKTYIQTGDISEKQMEIIIDAPFYDMKQWLSSGVIIHTGETILGRTAYAEWVNRLGGFATHNRSEGWVHRAILEVANVIANETGAEIVYEL